MKKLIFLLLGFALFYACQPGKKDQKERIPKVENHLMPAVAIKGQPDITYSLTERMHHYKVSGVGIAFVDQGEVAWARGYGYHSFDSVKKVTPNTMFQAASISKPLAALGALSLVEDSLLMLDRNVNRYLKSWQVPENRFTDSASVTLRRLMTHTAGLTVHGFPGYQVDETVPSVTDVLSGSGAANTGAVYPDTIPGRLWRYSGGGYTVMQLMMEEAAGKNFAQIMRERVLEPLSMDNSTYRQPLPEKYRKQASIAHNENGDPVEGKWHVYPEQAAAGLWTTPSDLGRYIIEVQRSLQGESDRVISQSMAREMLTRHLGDQGLGPALYGEGDSLAFSHGGANAGYRCQFFAFAKKGQGVAIMTNSDRGSDLISELLRSFSRVYGWSVFTTGTKEKLHMTEEELVSFAGKYRLNEDLVVSIRPGQGYLSIIPRWDENSIRVYPENPYLFFDLEKGWELKFDRDSITGEIRGFRLNEDAYFVKLQ